MPRIAPADTDVVLTGENVEPKDEPAQPQVSDKPFLVLVAEDGSEELDKISNVLLKDERISLGARAFHPVRMSPEDASNDPIISKNGKATPRFVLVSADFKDALALENNRVSISAVWDGMKAYAGKMYAKNLDTTVKEMRSLLLEYDKIDGERTILKAKEEKLKEKNAPEAELKEVATKLEQVEARQAKTEERERALWALKAKSA